MRNDFGVMKIQPGFVVSSSPAGVLPPIRLARHEKNRQPPALLTIRGALKSAKRSLLGRGEDGRRVSNTGAVAGNFSTRYIRAYALIPPEVQ
jgi:hypothetical protein